MGDFFSPVTQLAQTVVQQVKNNVPNDIASHVTTGMTELFNQGAQKTTEIAQQVGSYPGPSDHRFQPLGAILPILHLFAPAAAAPAADPAAGTPASAPAAVKLAAEALAEAANHAAEAAPAANHAAEAAAGAAAEAANHAAEAASAANHAEAAPAAEATAAEAPAEAAPAEAAPAEAAPAAGAPAEVAKLAAAPAAVTPSAGTPAEVAAAAEANHAAVAAAEAGSEEPPPGPASPPAIEISSDVAPRLLFTPHFDFIKIGSSRKRKPIGPLIGLRSPKRMRGSGILDQFKDGYATKWAGLARTHTVPSWDPTSPSGGISDVRSQAYYRAQALFAMRMMAILADHFTIFPSEALPEERAFISAFLNCISCSGGVYQAIMKAMQSRTDDIFKHFRMEPLTDLAPDHPGSMMAFCLGQAIRAIRAIRPNPQLDNQATNQCSFLREIFHLDTRVRSTQSAMIKKTPLDQSTVPVRDPMIFFTQLNHSVLYNRICDYLCEISDQYKTRK